MKKIELKNCNSKIEEAIQNALADYSSLFQCEIGTEWNADDGSLISVLAKAVWKNGFDESAEKDSQRAMKHLAEFRPRMTYSPAVACCTAFVSVSKTRTTKKIVDSHLAEIDCSKEKADWLMTEAEYKKLISRGAGLNESPEKIYEPKVVRVINQKTAEKCENCGGTGKTVCSECGGIGNGECPDCNGTGVFNIDGKRGERSYFISKLLIHNTRREMMLYNGEPCITCNGSGSIECSACGQTGEEPCSDCNGTGIAYGGANVQKVTSEQETYTCSYMGEVVFPDGETLELEPLSFREEIVKNAPIAFYHNGAEQKADIIPCSDTFGPQALVYQYLNDVLPKKNLVGANFVAYEIPNVCILNFSYADEDYRIFIINGMAYTRDLPKISFKEELFRTYKKHIR